MNRTIRTTPSRRSLRMGLGVAGLALVAFLAVALSAGPSHAELIRLADDSSLQGEVLSGDREGLRVRRLDNGGEVRLPWHQLAPDVRTAWRLELGLDLPTVGALTTTGDRIELLEDGTEPIEGEITDEDETTYTVRYLDRRGQEQTERINKNAIAEVLRGVQVTANRLKTSRDIYEELVAARDLSRASDHYVIANYCNQLGLYEEGLDHVNQAIALDAAFADDLAEMKAAFEELIAQRVLREALEAARELIRDEQFGQAEVVLTSVREVEDVADSILSIADDVAARLDVEATAFLTRRWPARISDLARDFLREGLRLGEEPEPVLPGDEVDDTVELGEARSYASGDLEEDIILSFVEETGLSAERVRDLFENRDRENSRAIRVRLSVELLEAWGRLRGRGASGEQDPTESPQYQQLASVLQRFAFNPRVRELLNRLTNNPEDVAEIQAEADRLIRELIADRIRDATAGGSRSLPPAIIAPIQNFQPGGGGGRRQPGETEGEEQPPTPAERWLSASRSLKRMYMIYVYCEASNLFERVDASVSARSESYTYR